MKNYQTVKKHAFTLFLVALNTWAMAQTAKITGHITTNDGKTAAFVNVILEGTNKGATADENGYYEISNIKAGNYIVSATFVGLETQSQKVQITDGTSREYREGGVFELNFILKTNSQQLSEVIVRGQQNINDKPVSIGKIAIRPMDLPQSVAVIDQKILEQQQVLRMSDALMNTTGVYIMGTTGGYQEEIAGRGYAFTSNNTFKNGVRYNNGILQELSALEKVEFLKGSGAILFGNVAAGGILNLVTKKPKFENGGSVSMRMGSFGLYKPTIDVYGAVNNSPNMAYRINTSYEKANSFREGVSSERFHINPSFLFKIGQKTDILLEGDYLKDERTPDFGTGAINYVIADMPRERFLGVTWAKYKAEQKSATLTVTHYFNENWQLRGSTAVQVYATNLYANIRPNRNNSFVQTDGKWIRGLAKSAEGDRYYAQQLDLTGRFKTGFINHQILFGADADQYNTQTTVFATLAKYDSINILNPTLYKVRNDIPDLPKATLTTAPIDRFGVYLQDLLSLGAKLKLLLGLRYSYQQTISDVLTFATNKNVVTTNFDGAFSPRLGLVYQPIKNIALFASYSNSFVLNTGTDISNNALPPSLIDQYEVGVKNELFNGLLSANVTFYQITNSNLAQTNLVNGNTNTNIKELAGEVTSKGVEIDLVTKSYRGLSFIGGYSFNDTRYTASNIYVIGSRLRYNPQHTANASIFYTFEQKILRGVQIGFTSLFVGDRVAGRSTRLTVANDAYKLMAVPNYVQFDASAGYSVKNISLRLKVGNLLDKLSYNVHDDNSVNPIAPRNFAATLAYKF
jgi:iron complex outermembrane recepter protein